MINILFIYLKNKRLHEFTVFQLTERDVKDKICTDFDVKMYRLVDMAVLMVLLCFVILCKEVAKTNSGSSWSFSVCLQILKNVVTKDMNN